MKLDDVQDLVNNKRVLLIGNGEHSESIVPSYNIVIRLNSGIQDKPADIWVNNLIQYHNTRWNWNKINFKYMLRLNAELGGRRLYRGYPKRFMDRTYFWNGNDYREMSQAVGYSQPFSGTTTLHWLCKYTEPESITIVGMDFFKDGKCSPIHRPEKDQEYVSRLMENYNIIKI